MYVQGFPPLLGPDPEVLILGSMPGVRAVHTGQYYAHPRNAFWRLLEDTLGGSLVSASYAQRVETLQRQRIAVWNVFAACWRPGSSDAKVKRGTATLNDVPGLLRAHPSIRRVCFNGRLPEQVFRRCIHEQVEDLGLDLRILPSSSAAHAARSYAQKVLSWREALRVRTGTVGGA